MKYSHYQLINVMLFKQNYDFVLLRCLEKSDVDKVLSDLNDSFARGHYSGYTIAHKIL
jgi:hypothetical protein